MIGGGDVIQFNYRVNHPRKQSEREKEIGVNHRGKIGQACLWHRRVKGSKVGKEIVKRKARERRQQKPQAERSPFRKSKRGNRKVEGGVDELKLRG